MPVADLVVPVREFVLWEDHAVESFHPFVDNLELPEPFLQIIEEGSCLLLCFLVGVAQLQVGFNYFERVEDRLRELKGNVTDQTLDNFGLRSVNDRRDLVDPP